MKKYDVIVIGGGSAGFAVLEQIAHQGLRIALVENRKLGGSCPNFACVPTKSLVKSAEVLDTTRNAWNFGIKIGKVSFDWTKVQKIKAEKVANTAASESKEDLKEKEVDLLWGTAKFTSPDQIEVGGKTFQADKFAITTGSRVRVPPINGINETGFINSDQAVELKRLPKSLAIIGAGPVGIELAQVFTRFGVQVAVINRGSQILNREEPEVAQLAQQYLENDGVDFILGAQIDKFEKVGKVKRIHATVSNQKGVIEVEEILLAAGRTPNIDILDLKAAKVKNTEKGLKVNDFLQTSQTHIYSAGDVTGMMLFTHAASYEGFVIGRNLLGEAVKADHRVVPRGTFCDPEVGSVGMMFNEAKKKGHWAVSVIMPYGGGRGDIVSDHEGLIKLTIDKKTRQILGASMIGRNAAEIVHLVALAMHAKITVDKMDTMIYAFPTYAEALAGITAYLE